MSNVDAVIDQLKAMFEGQNYSEEERTRLAGFVKNELDVPGCIWSLEDFEGHIDEDLELSDEERDVVCREAYNDMAWNRDITDAENEQVGLYVTTPVDKVLSKRPLELGTLYMYNRWDKTITEFDFNLEGRDVEEDSWETAEIPTGEDLMQGLEDFKGASLYYKVEQAGGSYTVNKYLVSY